MIIRIHTRHIHSLLLLFTFLTASVSHAQCPFPAFGDPFGPPFAQAPSPGNSTFVAFCSYPDEYTTVENVTSGNDYTVQYSGGSGTFTVVYDNTFTPVASGTGTVSFTATYSGTYFSACFIMPGCTADFSCNDGLWSNVTPLPPPPNNLPCDAINLTPTESCNYTTFTNEFATAAPGVTPPGCGGYLGGDVWFTTTIPATGNILIDTQIGVMLDGGMAVYTGTCGSLTLVECDDDDSPNGAMPSIPLSSLAPGTQIFIRIWEVGNNNNGSFGICVQELGTCGTALTNDFCESPAQLTQGPGNFTSTTSAVFTDDSPGNLSATFCGSIENNSWYQFTALNTTETFDFIAINNCVSSFGVQAAVYEVLPDVDGCCDVLNLVSNCYSPATTAIGTVTATPLTIGNTYVLMVDGFSGDACDFTIANWLPVTLPIELTNFYALTLNDRNAIRWETDSEINNDYFSILRSYDGIHFESIGAVHGAGTSQETNYYQFNDEDIRTGLVYYQLEQVDFDGQREKSEMIALDRSTNHVGLITAYPNPTSGKVIAEVNGSKGSNGTLTISDMNGTILEQKSVYTTGIEKHQFDLSQFETGLYFVRYQDNNSDQTIKLIKQ
ncbi:MAG: T9SS type A sorting domain-containing protein [Flavobacteriales bacterium]|nr:T9SS type A sorting domain-containing protein [Flavobacteriales bacterium]